MPIKQTYNLSELLAAKQDISEKDQPDGYAGLDANGDIVGPIVLRETTNGDIPIDREVVIKGDSVSVGDGSTIGGIEVPIDDETMKLIKPPDGAIMASRRATDVISLQCSISSGQFAVDWWDGTRTTHNDADNALKVCSDNALKIVKAYPATSGESLTYLNCYGNQLVSLDVSGLADVLYLTCSTNQLTSLDVSSLWSLDALDCTGNQLVSLDVSGLVNLTALWCRDNHIAELRAVGCVLSYGYTGFGWTSIDSNNLSADALNQFFTDLGEDVGATGIIDISDNPGAATCDTTIATLKGYTIITGL